MIDITEDTKREVYAFLEDLRESGATNMFGASPYLVDEFGFSRNDARDLLQDWMINYAESEE